MLYPELCLVIFKNMIKICASSEKFKKICRIYVTILVLHPIGIKDIFIYVLYHFFIISLICDMAHLNFYKRVCRF